MGQIFNEPLVTKYSFTFREGLEDWENDFLNLLVFNPELSGKNMLGMSIEKRASSYPDRGITYDMTLVFRSAHKFLTHVFSRADSFIHLIYSPQKTRILSEITVNDTSQISKTDEGAQREFFRLDIIKGVVSKVAELKNQPQHQTEQIPND